MVMMRNASNDDPDKLDSLAHRAITRTLLGRYDAVARTLVTSYATAAVRHLCLPTEPRENQWRRREWLYGDPVLRGHP